MIQGDDMKYFLTTALLGFALVGCADKKEATTPTSAEQATSPATSTNTATYTATNTANNETATAIDQTAQAEQEIHFTGPNDLTIGLKTTDNFETAQLTDNSDQTYQLKRVVSGSGIRLANEAGVSIHFKDFNGIKEGTVELVKDKPIEIKEFKK